MSQAQEVSQGRVLGVDLGQRRVGLAISDSGRLVASAFSVLTREASRDEDHANLARVVAETGANLVVVGLPLSLSGGRARRPRRWNWRWPSCACALPVPVELCDERFSTVVAHRSLIAAGRKGPARRQVVDQVAAADILQTWLDRHRNTFSKRAGSAVT